ncbi:peptidase S10 [bacterium]|nr:peptidase S10 [bacterium]
MKKRILGIFLCLILGAILFADEEKESKKPEFKPEFPKEVTSETKHSVTINGNPIQYTATAGNIVLKEENGKPKATFFYISYSKDGVKDSSTRPLTYSFNGGPGSSSVWLHLGVLGPKRVRMNDDGSAYKGSFALDDNAYSILDLTDLVFIDPVSTGYSRPVPGEQSKQFHGFEEDVESVGEFIRVYTTRAKRWSSPKFLAGESYGTTRAAGLVGWLQDRHGMYFNGVVLFSVAIDFQTLEFQPGNESPYMLFLPTYTATAWYHKKLAPDLQSDLQKAIQESRQFALNEYSVALLKGDQLSETERKSVAEKLARYTGLSQQFIESCNLRISDSRFFKELRRSERLTVGRLDTRFIGRDRDAAGEEAEYDPSYAVIQGSFTANFNDYVRKELKYENDITYEILTSIYSDWPGRQFQGRYINSSEPLRKAMTENPALKIFVANGYYDLATPFFASEYTFNHLGLDPSLRNNISMKYYEAGHMMYINKPSLVQLKSDLASFYQNTLQK